MINVAGLEVVNENRIEELKKQLADLMKEEVPMEKAKKNQKPGKPQAGRKYVLLTNTLKSWGNVPDQQRDLAKVLANNLEVGKEYTEAEVFDVVNEQAPLYPSIAESVQDPTYIFRYYRGLKNDGKHAGFVGRDFFRVIG
jgi:hypothetical protein